MARTRLLFVGLSLLLTLLAATPAAAQYIAVRVSIKIILDPTDGSRPPIQDGVGAPDLSNALIQRMFTLADDALEASYWRGYRFVLSEIVEVGSVCSTCSWTNPSYWYGRYVPNDNGQPSNLKDFETIAKQTPAFAWNGSAINVYFNEGMGNGAISSFPPPDARANETVLFGSKIFDPAFLQGFASETFVHETGHFFTLNHPQTGSETCCVAGPSCIGDGDGISDTLEDGQCFDRDELSLYHFGASFANIAYYAQQAIEDEYSNVMVYNHPDQPYGQVSKPRLTEGQLDAWTDAANGSRTNVCTGITRFVDTNGSSANPGSSSSPLRYVLDATQISAAGDIVMIQPGTYAENLTLSSPVTLRATRRGPVTIGN